MHRTEWKRGEVGACIDDLFAAAEHHGPQTVHDANGTFEIIFTPKKQSLKELFSKPGIISGDDFDP